MKLSLAWIFDHIDGNYQEVDVTSLVAKFNTHTAEIESFTTTSFNLDNFEMVKSSTDKHSQEYRLPDTNTVSLSTRTDSKPNSYYLIKKEGSAWRWATLTDFAPDRENIFPEFKLSEEEFSKSLWKQYLPNKDVILDVDNKSLTNRPDMWSHRGFAREIAFLLDLPFKEESEMITNIPCHRSEPQGFSTDEFSLTNNATEACPAFSLTKFSNVKTEASHPQLAFRLALIGERSINGLVNLTNYVMNDWGNPVHAYDADSISSGKLIIRFAKEEENLVLLGEEEISMSKEDLVVASESESMCLAGVKGGEKHSCTENTKNILFEVANFKPEVIRKSSQRNKVRTPSSARFEKTLDPQQLPRTVMRFVKLGQRFGIDLSSASSIYYAGPEDKRLCINVSHSFLETFSGLQLDTEQICQVLEKLEFKVSVNDGADPVYQVIVPSFRATKNVQTKHDILEEVARGIGFDKIEVAIPKVPRQAFDLAKIFRQSAIKRHLAYGCQMVEQANYLFYDEAFLSEAGLTAKECLELINPASENNHRLAKSLIPNLLKNLQLNRTFADNLRFFEIAKTWNKKDGEFVEQKKVAGVFLSKKGGIDFYAHKAKIEQIFDLCGESVIWEKKTSNHAGWEHINQTANLMLKNNKIGVAGKVNPEVLLNIGFDRDVEAFSFEIEIDPLLTEHFPTTTYKPISKYQSSYFDLSMFVNSSVTAKKISDTLQNIDPLIDSIALIDMFEKDSERSLAFRVNLQSQKRSIEKNDISLISSAAIKALEDIGAKIRT